MTRIKETKTKRIAITFDVAKALTCQNVNKSKLDAERSRLTLVALSSKQIIRSKA